MPTLMLRETLISYDNRYEHYQVPEHIRTISANCFNERWELRWLTLPEGIRAIGDNAFRMCIHMERIDMPSQVAEIGKSLFKQCRSLQSVVMPEGTCEIDFEMFRDCESLTEIVLPKSVQSVHESAFRSCHHLRYLAVPENVFLILPEGVRNIAARTYMERHGDSDERDVFNSYIREHESELMEGAIDANKVRAVQYMADRGMISSENIPAYLERAGEKRRTEITAVILEARKNQSEDFLDWDPFGDL